MKKSLLWLAGGLLLLIGGGALASLSVPLLTVVGIILAVLGVLVIIAWYGIMGLW